MCFCNKVEWNQLNLMLEYPGSLSEQLSHFSKQIFMQIFFQMQVQMQILYKSILNTSQILSNVFQALYC